MQTVETSSSAEAQRCRRAQYSGRTAELSLNGSKFLGMVRSVQEDRSRSPQRWIVTIVPTVEKPPLVGSIGRAPRSGIQRTIDRSFADIEPDAPRPDILPSTAVQRPLRYRSRGASVSNQPRHQVRSFGLLYAAFRLNTLLWRMEVNMNAAFSFLISVGIIAFGICIIAGTIAAGSPLAWTLMGLLTAIVGSISLYLATRDVKIA